MKALSILLVDDDDELRTCLQLQLELASHTVTCARDVATATRLLRERTFDVVLTDMLIGEHDGTEVMAAAHREQPDARIVAMSGGGDFLRPSYCLTLASALGACAPLAKPFSFGELVAAIEAHPLAV